MPPRNADILTLGPDDEGIKDEVAPVLMESTEIKRPPMKLVWRNIIAFFVLHSAALYALVLVPFVHPFTWIWTVLCYLANALGITAGAHRLWAHRSYKAKLPLRILLGSLQAMAFQNDIIEWARDHRVHHKYSETDADPHNAKRGFFFAHCGWLMCRKHPDVKDKGKQLDISDLLEDPVCVFQRKYYIPSMLFMCFVFPMMVPWYFWGETLWNSYFVCSILRFALCLNVTWFVNSWAHMYGNKPYDNNINPAENIFVTFGALGEGFHNYHHVFPQDYSTSEYGWRVNVTTVFIDFMVLIGQAYDRKKMSHEAVFRRKQRTGDGTTGFGYMETPKQE